jgi:hypothetical protein
VLDDALTVERNSHYLYQKHLSGHLVIIHSTERDYNLLQGLCFMPTLKGWMREQVR